MGSVAEDVAEKVKEKIQDTYEKLIEILEDLTNVQTLEPVMEKVKHSSRKLLKADGVTFVLKDKDKCFYADESAIGPLWKGQRFPMESCVSGWVMRNKKPVVIEDVFSDPRVPQDVYKSTFVKSLMMVPIRTQDPIGAIGCYWAHHHKASPEEVKVLQTIADATSMALLNVHLYEEMRSKIEELNRANRFKDEFLMLLSHELRTPMNAIIGWAQILVDAPIPGRDEVKVGLGAILRNSEQQMRLIDDLLDVSRILTGRLELESQKVDLRESLQSEVESFTNLASHKNIKIQMELDSKMRTIMADPKRLTQIFHNLMSNAIKFSSENSSILVQLDTEGGMARVRFQDHGIGMDPKYLEQAFKEFSQEDASETRKRGGLGLGLAIVKHLAEAMGGQVHAASRGPDKGTTMTLHFPLVVTESTQIQIPSEKEATELQKIFAKKRILAVDDNEDARQIIRMILQNAGASVEVAVDAKDAHEVLKRFKPDLIICDLNMPGEDGFSLMRKIRETQDQFPAIALTAYADKQHEKAALESGFDVFMAKPAPPSKLISAAQSLLAPGENPEGPKMRRTLH